jgi:putative FmdB family regulatory protein
MPIYEYKCDDCGSQFEKLVRRASDVPEIECPSCGQKHLTQALSTFAAKVSNGGGRSSEAPMCPGSGRPCGNPGMCGMN